MSCERKHVSFGHLDFSQKPDINAPTAGRKIRKLTASNCSSPQCLRTGSHRYSTARARRILTSRPPGCRRDTTRHPQASRNHPVSRTHRCSPSWVSPVNSTTNHTMSIQSPYIQGQIFNSKRNQHIRRHTTYQKFHLLTRKAQKERTV